MIIREESFFVTDNSSECEKESFFVKTMQNEKFVGEALKKGAKIIDINEVKKLLNINENIKIIGISGTNGKTTTASLIYETLLNLGHKCAMCGTRGAFVNGRRIDEKALTTAPILKTLSYLSEASKQECEFFVMEVSSHALVQNRIEGLKFAAKIFTNLTQDHLDFHKNFENYKLAKESFFKDECLKFINKDAQDIFYNHANSFTYGLNADYKIENYDLNEGINALISYKDKKFHINSKLVGLFNLYNINAALACINELLNLECAILENALAKFKGVSGRCERVSEDVIIDFAHTPDGIDKILKALSYKDLIVVFGAGGNRDKSKRPLMAQAVKKFAKIMIITSDNPRDEEPMDIIKDILSGIDKVDENVIVEVDRKKAIQKALQIKKMGDFVVILGKGDEEYQEIKGVKYLFNDKIVVKELLQ